MHEWPRQQDSERTWLSQISLLSLVKDLRNISALIVIPLSLQTAVLETESWIKSVNVNNCWASTQVFQPKKKKKKMVHATISQSPQCNQCDYAIQKGPCFPAGLPVCSEQWRSHSVKRAKRLHKKVWLLLLFWLGQCGHFKSPYHSEFATSVSHVSCIK